MGVTINKGGKTAAKPAKVKKVTQQLAPEPLEETLNDQLVSAELVDEYLGLIKTLEKHDDKVKAQRARAEELKKLFVGAADEFAEPTESVTLRDSTGDRKIEVSAKANTATITDMDEAKKALGTKTFMEIAKIGIGDLKSYLPKDKYEAVTTTGPTGPRKLKIS